MADMPFIEATKTLALTPQEQNLYRHHLNNLFNGGGVHNPDGSTSTVLQAIVMGPDSRYYNIPTVWNGQALPVEQARQLAERAGWHNWPSYATPDDADARYDAMHKYIEQDTSGKRGGE